MLIRRVVLGLSLVAMAVAAHAADYKLGSLEIVQPWSRATPPTAQAAGGFLAITNKGTTPDRLIAVRSAVSDKVEIHEMKMDGNVMRMRELEKGLEIPPGATVTSSPAAFTSCSWGSRRLSPRMRRCPSRWSSRRQAASTSSWSCRRWAPQPGKH